MNILTGIYLGINAWMDWKRREIDLRLALLFAGGILVLRLILGQELYGTGVLPGLGLLLISVWAKKDLGSGDGIITMAVGWAIGFAAIWRVLTAAFLLAGITGGYLVLGKKKDRREDMPFVPFLLFGFLIERWVC